MKQAAVPHLRLPTGRDPARFRDGHKARPSPPQGRIHPCQPGPGRKQRILWIDDEKSLVKLGGLILESLGYRVETATDPLGALELIRTAPRRFDLIITDMTMPGLPGDLLVARIKTIRSDLPVIISAGFSEKLSTVRVQDLGFSKLILKPLDTREIATTVREVLDAENPVDPLETP